MSLFGNAFTEVTDPGQILQVLRAYLRHHEVLDSDFIACIHVRPGATYQNWTVGRGGLVIEGTRPMGIVTNHEPEGDVQLISLTDSDSGYRLLEGSVHLSDITKLELMPGVLSRINNLTTTDATAHQPTP